MRIRLIVVTLIACVILAFFATRSVEQPITASNAVAVPVHANPGVYVGSVTLTNAGGPDRLLGVSVPDAGRAEIDGLREGSGVFLPGGTSAQLASDGLHIALADLDTNVTEGSLIPLTLMFEVAGDVTTRLRIAGMDAMDHSIHMASGIEAATPAPEIQINLETQPGANGFVADLNLQNLTLLQTPDGTPHVDGEGHAHLYLNGLKLRRLYGTKIEFGPLSPGDYVVRISLNAHDHQPYLKDGSPIEAVHAFTISQ